MKRCLTGGILVTLLLLLLTSVCAADIAGPRWPGEDPYSSM